MFFSSDLNNRTQTTQIADHVSNKATITFGVTQGSVLGPLLLLLYVNDIHECSSKIDLLVADDICQYTFCWKKFEFLKQ